MSVNTTKSKLSLLGICVLTVFLVILQLCFYLVGYEFSEDLYQNGALPTITGICWAVAAVGALLLAIPHSGRTSCQEFTLTPTLFGGIASLLAMISLVAAVALLAFPSLLLTSGTDPLSTLLSSTSPSDSTARKMLLAALVMALPAAAHFAITFALKKIHPAGIVAVLLFTAFTALRVYFDMRYLLMSPRRVMHLMALLAVMLFLILGELRLSRGIVTRRLYTAFTGIAVIFPFTDSITNLILWAMGKVSLGIEATSYCFLLAISLFALSRLISLCKESKPSALFADNSTPPTVESTSPAALEEGADAPDAAPSEEVQQ